MSLMGVAVLVVVVLATGATFGKVMEKARFPPLVCVKYPLTASPAEAPEIAMLKVVLPGAGTPAGEVENVTLPELGPAPDIQPASSPVFSTVSWHEAYDVHTSELGTILNTV